MKLQPIQKIKLYSSTGFATEILNLGAIVTQILAKDRNGFRSNVVLAYDVLEDYLDNPSYLGCTVGPVAGRTKNGVLRIDDEILQLDTQLHPNSLHSGGEGLHKVYWQVQSLTKDSVTLTHDVTTAREKVSYVITYTV